MKEFRLEELFDLQMGKTPARNEAAYWDSGDFKWISIGDLSKCSKYITETKECISNKAVHDTGISLIPENTVIMSFKLSIGKTAITGEPMYSNEAIMSFRDRHIADLLPTYIYYLLSNRDWDEGTNNAVMGKTLNKATISKVKVKIHDADKQREIVTILDKVSSIIEARQQELSTLDDLIKARFVEMFGDYKESVRLSEVATVTGGLTKNSKRESLPLKLPYLRVANVSYDNIDTTEMLEIGLTQEERDKTLLKYGDLLFVEGNGSPDQIGRVAVWRDEITPCVHQNHLIKARFNTADMLPVFAMHYYMTDKGRRQIQSKAVSTSGLYTLSVQKVADFLLPEPPISQQTQFAAFVAQIDKSKFVIQKSLMEMQTLFDSLMRDFFEER